MSVAENRKVDNVELEAFGDSLSRNYVTSQDFWHAVRLLWRERNFVARCTALGTLIALAVAFLIPARYTSTTRLMPPDSQSGMNLNLLTSLAAASMPQSGMGLASQLLGTKSSGALFEGILQSRTVEDRLIQRFDLRRVYWVSRWSDARRILERRTNISEDHKSGIITLDVSDRDAHRAASLGQAYVEELDRLVSQLTTSSAHRERVFLEGRLKAVKQDLDSAAAEFSQFASKNTAIDIPAQGKAMLESAARLQGELIAAESELRGLSQIYTDENIRVRSMKARTAELQRQLNQVGGISNQTSVSENTSLYPSIRELPLLGVTYADLYRKVKIEESVFEVLTKEFELAKVEEAKEIPTVRVLDQPDVPERKSFPPRLVIVIFGALLSLGFAAASVYMIQAWRQGDPRSTGRATVREIWHSVQDGVSGRNPFSKIPTIKH